MKFSEIETYTAYCKLVQHLWKDIEERGEGEGTFRKFGDEFMIKIEDHSDSCSPEQARQWCAAFEKAPFNCLVTVDKEKERLLNCFSKRIEDVLNRTADGNEGLPEAERWLEFMDNCRLKTLTWVKRCLEDNCRSEDIPTRSRLIEVTRKAFKVLRSAVPERNRCDTYDLLIKLKPPSGDDLWKYRWFREALWDCLVGEGGPGGDKVKTCLTKTLEKVMSNIELFKEWVGVFSRLLKNGTIEA